MALRMTARLKQSKLCVATSVVNVFAHGFLRFMDNFSGPVKVLNQQRFLVTGAL